MGCSWSSPELAGAVGNNYATFAFDPAASSSYFGVTGSLTGVGTSTCTIASVVTPTFVYTEPGEATATSVICPELSVAPAVATLRCDVPVEELSGAVTINFGVDGTVRQGLNPFTMLVTPTPSTAHYTSTSTLLQYISGDTLTLTTIVPSCTPTVAPKAKRACGGDNLGRLVKKSSAEAEPFCSTFTAATPTTVWPTFLSAYTESASRVSSACSCIFPPSTSTSSSASATTTSSSRSSTQPPTTLITSTASLTSTSEPPTSTYSMDCPKDNLIRAFIKSSSAAAPFCSTYTLSSATLGQSYPPYLTAYSATPSRISSACTCLNGPTSEVSSVSPTIISTSSAVDTTSTSSEGVTTSTSSEADTTGTSSAADTTSTSSATVTTHGYVGPISTYGPGGQSSLKVSLVVSTQTIWEGNTYEYVTLTSCVPTSTTTKYFDPYETPYSATTTYSTEAVIVSADPQATPFVQAEVDIPFCDVSGYYGQSCEPTQYITGISLAECVGLLSDDILNVAYQDSWSETSECLAFSIYCSVSAHFLPGDYHPYRWFSARCENLPTDEEIAPI